MLGKLNHSRNSFYRSVKLLRFSIDHSSVKCSSPPLSQILTGKSGSMTIIGAFQQELLFTLVTVSLWLCSAPRDRTDSGHSSVTGSSLGRSGAGARSEARNRNIELERDGRPEGTLLFTAHPPPVSQTMLLVSNFGKYKI